MLSQCDVEHVNKFRCFGSSRYCHSQLHRLLHRSVDLLTTRRGVQDNKRRTLSEGSLATQTHQDSAQGFPKDFILCYAQYMFIDNSAFCSSEDLSLEVRGFSGFGCFLVRLALAFQYSGSHYRPFKVWDFGVFTRRLLLSWIAEFRR